MKKISSIPLGVAIMSLCPIAPAAAADGILSDSGTIGIAGLVVVVVVATVLMKKFMS